MMVVYDPQKYQESSLDSIWKTSMQEEFKSLEDNDTQELVPLPSKMKLVQCKWVYRTKMDVDGSYVNYNMILVSKWFSQFHGVDYTETFAST